MGMAVRMNVAAFKEQLRATVDELHKATRPAAQAGAQIIYERAKLLAPVSDAPHMFHGTHKIYGPYAPGTLRDSIYQVYSKDNSFKDVSTYHISWNKDDAPYGFMVELGTSRAPAHSFIGRAVVETRAQVREAIKTRYIAEVNK
jgi:HK97 gp10 family phage protein